MTFTPSRPLPDPVPDPAFQQASTFRRRLRPLLRLILILAALHAYIGWRLLPAMPIGPLGWGIGVVLLALSTLLMPLGMFSGMVTADHTLGDRLTWVGTLLMGLFSSLFVLTMLRDVALLFLPAGSSDSTSAMMVPALALLASLIGLGNARRVAKVVDVDIPLAGLPPELDGFTIVQLSDIHVGPTIKAGYVEAIVERVNSLDADAVAITGDLVDGNVRQLTRHTAPLARLQGRHGVYVVTGNHEYYSGAHQWIAEFRRLGLVVLMNQHVVIQHRGERLILAGVADYGAHQFDVSHRSDPRRALAGAPPGVPRILLAHQPRSAEAAASAGFDLQISGHTHGGQFWPWNLFVRLQQPYTAGLHRLDKLWVYTSRGTGYWGPPKRFGAPAEITRLRLVAA
jgi:predicted MPP superfamily phosphohydrolase